MNKFGVLAKMRYPSEVIGIIRKEVRKFGSLDISPELSKELSYPGDNICCKDLIQDELLPVLCILYLRLMPYYLEFVELWEILSECLKFDSQTSTCLSDTMQIRREAAEFNKKLNLEIKIDERLLRECLVLFGNLEIFNIHAVNICKSITNSMYEVDDKIFMDPHAASILDCINMILLYKSFRHPALGLPLYQGYDALTMADSDEPIEIAKKTILGLFYNREDVGKGEIRLVIESIVGKVF